jgi:hypothetical protein
MSSIKKKERDPKRNDIKNNKGFMMNKIAQIPHKIPVMTLFADRRVF